MSTIEFESKICLSGKNGKYFVIPAYFVKLLKLQPDSRFKFNLRKSDSKTWVSSTMFEGVPQFKPSSSCTLHLLTSNYGQKFDTIKIGDKVVVKISYDSSRNLCITHKALSSYGLYRFSPVRLENNLCFTYISNFEVIYK